MGFDAGALASAAIASQPAYAPGEQPSDGGWLKLNTNENPFPPAPAVVEAVRRELGETGASLRLYPSPGSNALREAAARFHGLTPGNVLAGNGSDDVLNLLVRAFSDSSKPCGMLDPSYSLYTVLAGLNGARMMAVPVDIEGRFDADAVSGCGANLFFLTNPNAPLGVAIPQETVRAIAARFPGILVVDEAYAPFSGADAVPLLREFPNVVITRTFSKAYSLAGLRVGYALGAPEVIALLDRVRDSYNLDRLAQAAGAAALGARDYYAGVIEAIRLARDQTTDRLRASGWRVLPSQANFILAAPPPPATAAGVFAALKSRKILVRHFPRHPVTAPFLRISIGSPEEMRRFATAALEAAAI